MRRIRFALTLGLMLGLASSGPARAQTALQVIQDFGMIGTWATSCSEAASPSNPYERIEASGQGLRWTTELGSKFLPNEYILLGAKRAGPDEIALRLQVTFAAGTRVQNHTRLVRDGRSRTMSNVDEDGTVRVKDGVVLSNKRDTPWQTKCQ